MPSSTDPNRGSSDIGISLDSLVPSVKTFEAGISLDSLDPSVETFEAAAAGAAKAVAGPPPPGDNTYWFGRYNNIWLGRVAIRNHYAVGC